MSKTYETIIKHGPYKAEIYDNCYAVIEAKKDRSKYRVRMDGTKWHGNTGGYHEYKVYLDPKCGRKIVRAYRSLHIANKKGDWSGTPMDAIYAAIGWV
jgi:hypothetical protein